ncbi:MAG: arginine deiminase-related protein [Rhodothermales bacterium]|nr:arginine deiminase-related protein [Rhodothermales bacterium]
MPVLQQRSYIDFSVEALPTMPAPRRVLMTTPAHFEVVYVINPHMEGHIGTVDRSRAQGQWQDLKSAYERIGIRPAVIEGSPGQPDMVFCANQTLPFTTGGKNGVFLSRMEAPQRRDEVTHYARFFSSIGYTTVPLPDATAGSFEGMGDAIWHPGRALLWGGYGYRTDAGVYPFIAERLGVPVVLLELTDSDFYHLDTCFSVLDERSVLIYPGAFTQAGVELIHALFERVIEAPDDESRTLFACNAHCPDGRHVLIQRGCRVTNERLREAGYEPIELDTDEFLKSGGSVFCMKQMYW